MKLHLLLILIVSVLVINGCTKDTAHYKQQADKEVYAIIDEQWKDDFGPRSNYKITETQNSPNDLDQADPLKDILPKSGILSLEDAVRLATYNNRRYQKEKEILYTRALDLTLAAHRFAPTYFSESAAGYSKNNKAEAIAAASNIGRQRLFDSGMHLTTDIAFAWADILTGDLKSGLGAIFQAALTKPLLRDSQRKILAENLTQAQRDSLYQIRLFNRFRKELAVSVTNSYYNTLLCYEKLENARQNHDNLKKTYQLMEKMVKVGRLENFELQQAQQDILESRDICIKQDNLCKQSLDQFKRILSIPPTANIDIDTKSLSVLASKGLTAPAFSEQQAVETALQTRLDLLNASDSIADAKRKIGVAAEAFRASLDLTASTSSTTRRTSTKDLSGINSNNSVGLELDLNLDKKAERNQYRKALIALDQAKRNYQESRDITAMQVRTAFRKLTEAANVRDIQLKSLDLAANRLKKTSILLQYGRSNTRDILDAQEDLFKAKNAASEALVEFTVATLEFYRDAGVMEIKEDGMWKTKKTAQKPEAETLSEEIRAEEAIANWLKKRSKQ